MNGEPQPPPGAGRFVTLNRDWADGDRVDLSLPMTLSTITGVNNSVSLARGPLVYSLKMPQQSKVVTPGPDGFVQLEITSADPWNFALKLDPAHLADQVAVHTAPMPASASPFQPDLSPVSLSVTGRRVPSWRTDYTGRTADDPPLSPLLSDEPDESVTLVPFGAQTLRVTAFPFLGQPTPPAGTYACHFADTDAPGWVTYGGNWYVDRGQWAVLPIANTAGTKAVASGTDFADFTYDADITPGPTGDTGVIFRVSHPTTGDNAFDGYYAGVSPGDGRVMLGRCNAADNAWIPLAEARRSIKVGVPTHLRIVATGPSIQVFVGEASTPVLSTTDATFSHGAIGVRHYTTTHEATPASFANIFARQLRVVGS